MPKKRSKRPGTGAATSATRAAPQREGGSPQSSSLLEQAYATGMLSQPTQVNLDERLFKAQASAIEELQAQIENYKTITETQDGLIVGLREGFDDQMALIENQQTLLREQEAMLKAKDAEIAALKRGRDD